MSEDSLRPLIVLHVPHRHEIDPQALESFKEHVGQCYGASVLDNPRLATEGSPAPILLGHWDAHLPGEVTDDLKAHLGRIFFNLDWLNLEDAL